MSVDESKVNIEFGRTSSSVTENSLDLNGDGVVDEYELGAAVTKIVLRQLFGVTIANNKMSFTSFLHSVLIFFNTINDVQGTPLPAIGTPERLRLLSNVLHEGLRICAGDIEDDHRAVNGIIECMSTSNQIPRLIMLLMTIIQSTAKPLSGADKKEYVMQCARATLPYMNISRDSEQLILSNLPIQIDSFILAKHGELGAAAEVASRGCLMCLLYALRPRRNNRTRQ